MRHILKRWPSTQDDILLVLLLVAHVAAAQSWSPPAESQRCPSKWGTGDERDSGNLMKPEQVLKAAKMIRTGEVIELSQVLDPDKMPFFPGHQLSILTKRTNVLPQSNRRISNELTFRCRIRSSSD